MVFSVLQHLLEVIKVLKIAVIKSFGTNWLDTVVPSPTLMNALRNHRNHAKNFFWKTRRERVPGKNVVMLLCRCLGDFVNAL